jgi:hypothetical protein
MDLVVAWVAFPAVLLLLALGGGLLVDRVLGTRVPGALIPATGLAVLLVVGQFLSLSSATAGLTIPVAVLLAGLGLGLGGRELRGRADGWVLATGLASFAILAAPIVLSGEATFAGYIKLDDTATWLALTDRVMESGRSLDGLDPSTYEATLAFNLGDGYPVGVFLPLGIASALTGQDVAWTVQPYMAALGTSLALALGQIAAPLLASRPLRALVAVVGSQAALLYGYYLWGGIKEIAAAALLASAVPLTTFALARRADGRTLVPLALVCAAEIGVLSVGGVVWLLAPLVGALSLLATTLGRRTALRAAAGCTALTVAFSLPVLLAGGLLPPTSSPLTSADARGNLIEPLEPMQLAGIWPAGDFRLDPAHAAPTTVLVGIALAAAVVAVVYAWRRRAWTVPLYVVGSLLACVAICVFGSPWIDGKALATASPAIPFGAALGGAVLYARGKRAEGAVLLVAIAGGVLWSNALQYRDVDLAPRDQLAELERIGERIQGEGPTLMTEYQPYGARHFLRDADPEAASELRRRRVPLVQGGTLEKGAYADLDRFGLDGLMLYRTLVLRRGPSESRPPWPYELASRDDFYEVWQRADGALAPVIEHVGLGDATNPTAQPSCADVRLLAARAGPETTLVAASRPPSAVVPLSTATYPADWDRSDSDQPRPTTPGDLTARVETSRAGDYEIWLGGSVRPRVELLVDGQPAGEVRHQLNSSGLYVRLGEARLGRGVHAVTVRFDDPDLHPGSGGRPDAIGPLALSASDAAESQLVEIPAGEAERRLCGRRWDWIELVGA